MLQVNELDDVKKKLKAYYSYGYANQTAMDDALTDIAGEVELKLKGIPNLGIQFYEYVKGLAGNYGTLLEYSYLYKAEVYLIAAEFVSNAIETKLKQTSGGSISLPDYSESRGGVAWFVNDKNALHNKYIEFMYSAGYKINSVLI